jgi:DNA-binding NarL/FixJ family response regulator
MPKIRVAIIEDSPVVREMTAAIIRRSEEFIMGQAYGNAEDAIAFLGQRPPDIVLVDIQLPGMSGIKSLPKLIELCPKAQFMMLTGSDEDEDIFEALKAGATGYLLKGQSPGELLTALHDLYKGGSPMSSTIARKVVTALSKQKSNNRHQESIELSDREMELLGLLSDGLRYKEIADKLYISVPTVKSHLHSIYKKMHVSSRTEAVNKLFPK